ncbi:MAG: hypothetical protein K2X36_00805 [Microbacteriaceae bacterium]|nr:hypothetical protein [Microbacteriaceae bacterium]
MTSRSLIILGATGDLTSRLLLPALDGVLDQVETDDRELELDLIGAGHDEKGAGAWDAMVTSSPIDRPTRSPS